MAISVVTNLFVSFCLATQPVFAPAAETPGEDVTPRPAPFEVVAPAAVVPPPSIPSPAAFETRRAQIFDALCAGDPSLDAESAAHLWNLAGRLAAADWSPPRMNVDVVVSSAPRGK